MQHNVIMYSGKRAISYLQGDLPKEFAVLLCNTHGLHLEYLCDFCTGRIQANLIHSYTGKPKSKWLMLHKTAERAIFHSSLAPCS